MFFWTHWIESSSFEEGDTQPHKDKSTDTSSAKDVIQRDTEDSRQSKEFGQIYRPSHMAPKSFMQKKLVRSFYEIIEWSNTRCNMERTCCYSTYTWFLRNQHMVQQHHSKTPMWVHKTECRTLPNHCEGEPQADQKGCTTTSIWTIVAMDHLYKPNSMPYDTPHPTAYREHASKYEM
jgi:hypothetical protein